MKRFLLSITVTSVLIVGVVLIALAGSTDQQDGANHLRFNGFSFSFDPALAENVNIAHFAGDPIDYEAPGGPDVAHVSYSFYNGMTTPETVFSGVGELRVYQTADLVGYDHPTQRFNELQSILNGRPDLVTYSVQLEMTVDTTTLPFMPVYPAMQVIRGQAHYVDTDALSGIAYVTAFRQDASPLLAHEFMYTFQGISHDGNYYVAASMPVSAALFPDTLADNFDYGVFMETFNDYLAESTALLNASTSNDFTPSLTLLDEIVQSIAFDD